jgi:hypothetical protein
MGVSVKAAWLEAIRDNKPAQQQQRQHDKATAAAAKPVGKVKARALHAVPNRGPLAAV